MEHHDAVRLSSVEKYLLGELSPELRDEFEEHFFDCQECATDLRATAAFLEAAKEELKTFPAVKSAASPAKSSPAKKSRLAWLWAPAFVVPALAACLLVIAYQNMVVFPHFRGQIAELQAPQIPPSISLAGGTSRGGQTPSITVRRMQAFLMLVDIPTHDRFSSYTCLLYFPSGSLAWRLPVSAQAAKDTVPISVPAANWVAGTYTLVVQGLVVQGNTDQTQASGVDLGHKHFDLKIQD